MIVLLFVCGLLFSAFFSGSETGFYRANRVRLALDARSGARVARGLIWLANNSALFVATTLVGNNLANYVTSLAVVLMAQQVFTRHDFVVELAASIFISPFVFVYGELLPKYLFFRAPNRLLQLSGPLFLVCTACFLPIASVLWVMSRLIQAALGQAPEKVQLSLARKELRRVLDEGHAVGLLRPGQRRLLDGMFEVANQPLVHYVQPINRLAQVPVGTPLSEMLVVAQRKRACEVIIMDHRRHEPIGYVRAIEVQMQMARHGMVETRPLLMVNQHEPPIAVLTRLQNENQSLACVVDEVGETIGLVNDRSLLESLMPSR